MNKIFDKYANKGLGEILKSDHEEIFVICNKGVFATTRRIEHYATIQCSTKQLCGNW